MIRRALLAAPLAALPLPAAAHPHVFIDTAVSFVLDDQNRVTALRVSWTYDALYSLLILEERGLDADYDGEVTEEERATLEGFDLNWIPGFEGDTYLATEAGALALGPPEAAGVTVSAGQITSTHLRPLAEPVAVGPSLSLKPYDPTYYTAYTLSGGATAEGGAGCEVTIRPADLDAAYTLLEEYLYGPRSAEYTEDNFPEVGEAFADTAILTCAPPS